MDNSTNTTPEEKVTISADNEKAASNPESPSPIKAFLDFLWLFVKLIAVVFIVRTYVLQPFLVEGSSMQPRFETNDYLLVDKLSYKIHEPARGDIIVFKYPRNESVNYVKRIIGLPGDTVEVKDDGFVITNELNPKGYKLPEPYVSDGNLTKPSPPDERTKFIVAPGEYFVAGDNREGSSDSREWGLLPKFEVIGKVFIQAYPLDRFALIPHASYPIKP